MYKVNAVVFILCHGSKHSVYFIIFSVLLREACLAFLVTMSARGDFAGEGADDKVLLL